MPYESPDTDQLLEQVAAGSDSAAQSLLARHRRRLSRLVAVHLDPRISARVDPSDVVQELLTEAFQRLPRYVIERPVSFYPWLRQIAWQRLRKLHRGGTAPSDVRCAARERILGCPTSRRSNSLTASLRPPATRVSSWSTTKREAASAMRLTSCRPLTANC